MRSSKLEDIRNKKGSTSMDFVLTPGSIESEW